MKYDELDYQYTILKGKYKPWRGCPRKIGKSTNQRSPKLPRHLIYFFVKNEKTMRRK